MKKNKQNGYALLFVMVIITIISAVTAGLANTALKEAIISSVARDSQSAFYASDTATECALYFHYNYATIVPSLVNSKWSCGKTQAGGTYDLTFSGGVNNYSLVSSSASTTNEPCFNITSTTTSSAGIDTTVITSKGYNICNTSNSRSVERAIKATIQTIPE